jgi:hypothetical protein
MESRTTSAIMPSFSLADDGSNCAIFTVKDTKGRIGIFIEHFDKDARDTKLSLMWTDPKQAKPGFNQTDFPTREAAVAEFKKWKTCYTRGILQGGVVAACLAEIGVLPIINEESINRAMEKSGQSGDFFNPRQALDTLWLMRWNEIDASNMNSAFKKVSDPKTQKVLQLLKDYEGGMLLLPQFLGRALTGHVKRHHIKAVKSVISFYEWDESVLNFRSIFTPYSPEQKAEFYGAPVLDVLTRLKMAMGTKEAATMHAHGDLFKILKVVANRTHIDFFKINVMLPGQEEEEVVRLDAM